ncbi:hypothetical protein BS50DRAFT_579332 [Corynespora cassiicola Philippines]|uniref:F-box domain-containing protein n=1 Tax=Corynespora cassiicola Philippines TaxID=1448308 RepID=A0A2T2N454_CORCC|nr:hypothetical protein BS50DRAFT_579332 [Corynespora cassiicola Philippines]
MSPSLLILPTELLLEIATYLEIPSGAALALTCRRMYGMLTDNKWTPIKANDISAHMELIELISRDDPKWVPCRSCQSMHSTEESSLLRGQNMSRKAENTDIEAKDWVPIGLKLLAPKPNVFEGDEILLELLQTHKLLVELRNSRYYPSGLLNKGMCLQLLALNEERSISLPQSNEEDAIAASLSFVTKPVLRTALMIETTIGVTLLDFDSYQKDLRVPVKLGSRSLGKLRRVLDALKLTCCLHCTPAKMTEDAMCKLNQYLFFSSECGCSTWQPENACQHHYHECGCRSEVQIAPKGAACVEIIMWQEFSARRMGRRGLVKHKFIGHRRGNSSSVNAVWES